MAATDGASMQETWINNHHTDTRMAGVLGPIQKTMVGVHIVESGWNREGD